MCMNIITRKYFSIHQEIILPEKCLNIFTGCENNNKVDFASILLKVTIFTDELTESEESKGLITLIFRNVVVIIISIC